MSIFNTLDAYTTEYIYKIAHSLCLQEVHRQMMTMNCPYETRIAKDGYVIINGIFNVKRKDLCDTYVLEDDYTCHYDEKEQKYIKKYKRHYNATLRLPPNAYARKAKYCQYQNNGEWWAK